MLLGAYMTSFDLFICTRIPYQIKKLINQKFNFYFTRYHAFVQKEFFNNYLSRVFFTIIYNKKWKIILDYYFIYFYYF